MNTLHPTPGLIRVYVMDPKPWRQRVDDEDKLLAQLNELVSEAATRRAEALLEGVAAVGRPAVARELGISWTAVDKAIKKYERKKAAGIRGTTTE